MAVTVGSVAGRTLWEALGEIPDRRGRKGRQYPLRAIVGLSLAAMIAGADDLMGIFRWARRLPPEALRLFGLTQAHVAAPQELPHSWVIRLARCGNLTYGASRCHLTLGQ